MNIFIKPSIIIGAILGAIFALFSLLPNAIIITFFTFSIIGAITLYYLKKNNYVGFLSLQDGALIGSIAGFIATLSFAVIFMPTSLIINFIFNLFGKPNVYFTNYLFTNGFGFFSFLMIIIFLALLSALFNAFSALSAAYIYERLEEKKLDKDNFHFEIEK